MQKPFPFHLLFKAQHNFKTLHPAAILINDLISSYVSDLSLASSPKAGTAESISCCTFSSLKIGVEEQRWKKIDLPFWF